MGVNTNLQNDNLSYFVNFVFPPTSELNLQYYINIKVGGKRGLKNYLIIDLPVGPCISYNRCIKGVSCTIPSGHLDVLKN